MRTLLSATFLALITSTMGLTQNANPRGTGPSIGNPGGTNPGTREQSPGRPAPRQSNLADHSFAQAAVSGGLAEVDLAKLAEQASQTDPVKAFARQMIEDHSKANRQLVDIGAQQSIPVAQDVDLEHKQVRDRLAALQGPQFEIEYLRIEQQDHQRTAQLLEYEIGSGENPALQSFAVQTLPTVLRHLSMVQNLMGQSAQQNPQIAAEPPKASGLPSPQTPNTLKN